MINMNRTCNDCKSILISVTPSVYQMATELYCVKCEKDYNLMEIVKHD